MYPKSLVVQHHILAATPPDRPRAIGWRFILIAAVGGFLMGFHFGPMLR